MVLSRARGTAGLLREQRMVWSRRGAAREQAADERRYRPGAGRVKVVEDEKHVPLEVVQRLAKRLAELRRSRGGRAP